jgi:hypothetical protein
MKPLLSRLALAALLAAMVSGCAPTARSIHGHRHGGAGAALVAGIIVGAALAEIASSSRQPQPEPEVYSPYPYPAPPPLPPSPRDRVDEDHPAPAFDPRAARAVLSSIDLSACRQAGARAGFGHAKVTIDANGNVSKVVIDEPAGLSADAVKCIGERLGAATFPPFGGSLTIGTTYYVR